MKLFKETTNREFPIRRMSIAFGNVKPEEFASLTLFTDLESEQKERSMQQAILSIKKKYGKNSIVKGMDLQEKATTRKRNKLVGGHNGE
jgi:DNA polymerase V